MISVTDLSNDFASAEAVSETVKKSNESQDQPRNATYRVRLVSQGRFLPVSLMGRRTYREIQPLRPVEQCKSLERVRRRVHGRH